LPEIIIKLTVPEGTNVIVTGIDGAEAVRASQTMEADPVEGYFRDYLSDNGRKVFAAAARIETFRGPGFTLEDVAANLNVTYDTVRSWHRTAGRSAKRWRKETGTREPVRLEAMDYGWDATHEGFRTAYRLPEGVADKIDDL
jgi:hypothetical protein